MITLLLVPNGCIALKVNMVSQKMASEGKSISFQTISKGTLYFVILVTTLAFSLFGIAIPIVQEVFSLPIIVLPGSVEYYLPQWGYPLVVLAGLLLWTVTMHLVKWIGGLHGRYAKAMLVVEQE